MNLRTMLTPTRRKPIPTPPKRRSRLLRAAGPGPIKDRVRTVWSNREKLASTARRRVARRG